MSGVLARFEFAKTVLEDHIHEFKPGSGRCAHMYLCDVLAGHGEYCGLGSSMTGRELGAVQDLWTEQEPEWGPALVDDLGWWPQTPEGHACRMQALDNCIAKLKEQA